MIRYIYIKTINYLDDTQRNLKKLALNQDKYKLFFL
jgi:hypothetical protein